MCNRDKAQTESGHFPPEAKPSTSSCISSPSWISVHTCSPSRAPLLHVACCILHVGSWLWSLAEF